MGLFHDEVRKTWVMMVNVGISDEMLDHWSLYNHQVAYVIMLSIHLSIQTPCLRCFHKNSLAISFKLGTQLPISPLTMHVDCGDVTLNFQVTEYKKVKCFLCMITQEVSGLSASKLVETCRGSDQTQVLMVRTPQNGQKSGWKQAKNRGNNTNSWHTMAIYGSGMHFLFLLALDST